MMAPEVDKWRKWVFSIGFNFDLNGEKHEKEFDYNIDLSASKITEMWKFTSYFNFDYNEDRFDHENRIIKDVRKQLWSNARLSRKMGEHWAIGASVDLNSDVVYNNKLSMQLAPSIEYNIFPYSEFSKRQFPIRLGIAFNHQNYYEKTIYDKTSEFTTKVFASTINVIRGKWGNVINILSGSFYTHDFSKNNFKWINLLNYRLFKGFSINGYIAVDLIHNQLFLEKGGLTVEEVLLQRKQLRTSYNYHISFGFSYSFGSMYQNIVNTRFGY